MSEQEVSACVAQRIIIQFLGQKSVKLAEIVKGWTYKFKEETVSGARGFT